MATSNNYRAAVTEQSITIRPLAGDAPKIDGTTARKIATEHLGSHYPSKLVAFKIGRARASKTIPEGTEFPLTRIN